jgi:SAM-dependent methyltransferase
MTGDSPSITASASSDLIGRMRADWNSRAAEDARFYIACGRRSESDARFKSHAAEVISRIRRDFHWLSQSKPLSARRFLEIGCGVGRLMEHLAQDCGEIHGVDISDEMVAQGRKFLSAVPHAHLHVATESDLRAFADSSFDLVYSYAVLQHLPAADLFWRYIAEAFRVLAPGGLFVFQFNGSDDRRDAYDTWAGVIIPAEPVVLACQMAESRIRSIEGQGTQYVWITAQKSTDASGGKDRLVRIDEVIGADDRRGIVVADGPKGFLSLYVRDLPLSVCAVTELSVDISGEVAPANYVGGLDRKGRRQINAFTPQGLQIGAAEVVLKWRNAPIAKAYPIRVIPAPAAEPRVVALSDGLELGLRNTVVCGWAKLWITNLVNADQLEISVAGMVAPEIDSFCEDKRERRYQVNVRIPDTVEPGTVTLQARVRDVTLPPVEFTLVRNDIA